MLPTLETSAPPDPAGSARDLAQVEQLLERCWRALDDTELNVRLADLVRLLEFKEKLRPAVDAQKTFWSMIDQMRREELGDSHEPPGPAGGPSAAGHPAAPVVPEPRIIWDDDENDAI